MSLFFPFSCLWFLCEYSQVVEAIWATNWISWSITRLNWRKISLTFDFSCLSHAFNTRRIQTAIVCRVLNNGGHRRLGIFLIHPVFPSFSCACLEWINLLWLEYILLSQKVVTICNNVYRLSRYISDQSGCNRRIWHYPTAAYFLNCKLRRALFHFLKKTLIFKVVVRFFVENPFCQIPLIALLSKRISVSICRCQSLWNWDGDASNNWKEWDGIRALVSVVCCWLDTVPHKCKLLTFSERWAMIKKEPLLDWRHCRMGKE